MKIQKLPDKIDPDMITEDLIRRVNSVCPFCGETRYFDGWDEFVTELKGQKKHVGIGTCLFGSTWYGHRDERENAFSFLKFWEKNHHWRTMQFHCHTCGAKWESDPFPEHIGMDY